MNIPRSIRVVIENGKATLHECQTIYSVGDVYLMIEMIAVESHNRRKIEAWAKAKQGN